MHLDRKFFINSNTNKNNCGFLLIDILLGLALFMGTAYYCLLVFANKQFLLQSCINNAIHSNNCAIIAKNFAYGSLHNSLWIDAHKMALLDEYHSELKHISFTMCDGRRVAVELVIVKSNTTSTTHHGAYYIPKEV
jgi:hypothetical protein